MFPGMLKIAPAEQISTYVRQQVAGLPAHSIPVAPRQIPVHAGFVYFELDQSHELWKQLAASGGVAFHVAGDVPGLALEFWAIRSG
jgi:type VI secretion system protein ImpJ